MLGDPKVYLLALVYFCLLGATYTMVFWLPTLIQSWGVKDLMPIGIYAAIPNAVGVIGMILIGRNSDKWRDTSGAGISRLRRHRCRRPVGDHACCRATWSPRWWRCRSP